MSAAATSPVVDFEAATHTYRVAGRKVPSVTQVLEGVGLTDFSHVAPDVLAHAQDRGTKVHQACALLVRGELEWSSVADEIEGYVRAADSFLRHHHSFSAEYVEHPFYEPHARYCGTIDLAGRMAALRTVIDFKSGSEFAAAKYQLAAYGNAIGYYHRAVVKLSSDGKYKLHWFRPETFGSDLDVFLAGLKICRAKEGL